MRNAVAHKPRADDADCFDGHAYTSDKTVNSPHGIIAG
jgi:hypothetical protein